MSSVKEYFSGVGRGLKSLVSGMAVTGRELVTPKVTEQYPENRETLAIAPRFRAELTLKYDSEGRHKCIACGICQMNCPNGTIQLQTKMVDMPDGKKKRKLDKYMYDLGSCTFCQLCVTNCPTDALEFSNDFEQAVFTRDKLVKKLNYLPEKEEPKPTPEQIAKMQAEKEAKIAAAKAAAEAKKAAAASGSAPAAEADPLAGIELNDAQKKALAAAASDPEKLDKIRAAILKAAQLKAAKNGASNS